MKRNGREFNTIHRQNGRVTCETACDHVGGKLKLRCAHGQRKALGDTARNVSEVQETSV